MYSFLLGLVFTLNLSVGTSLSWLSLPLLMCSFFVGLLIHSMVGGSIMLVNQGGLIWSEVGGLLILLTLVVGSLSLVSSVNELVLGKYNEYCGSIMLLCFLSVSCFLSDSLFLVYFFFESSLVPLTYMVLRWGHQPEREEACFYMNFYMVVFSLPFIIGVFMFLGRYSTDSMLVLNRVAGTEWSDEFLKKGGKKYSSLLWVFLLSGFLVKTPLFMLHMWLPKAHVEAPLGGSMMLAGVVLKMGPFGMMRLFNAFRMDGHLVMSIIFGLAVVGSFYSALVCLVQSDLKSLVAYSSIAHMNLATAAVMTLGDRGWAFSVMTMLSHGFSSPSLFLLAFYCFKGVSSRSMAVCRGFWKTTPMVTFFWFLSCTSNFGCPTSLEFFAEVGSVVAFYDYCSLSGVLMTGVAIYFVAVYSLHLFSIVNHGGAPALIKPRAQMFNVRFMLPLVYSTVSLYVLFWGGDWAICWNFGLMA